MATDLKDYLTDEERRQMDALIAKAEKRLREKGEEGCRGQFIMVSCQCGCSCGQTGQNDEKRDNLPNDMENLLRQVCDFCKKHDMCPEYCQDELPFP